MNATLKPISQVPFTQSPTTANLGVNPNATRYGLMPFKNVNLVSGFGTFAYYVQPEGSPFHREIPKNRLIPFETFSILDWGQNPDIVPTPNQSAPRIATTVTKTALEAATELIIPYGSHGYRVLNSLEGVPQEQAIRIFTVLVPFDYKLADLREELEFDAINRISALDAMIFDIGTDGDNKSVYHTVPALLNSTERVIAENLRIELLEAVNIAISFAKVTLDTTKLEMTVGFSSGKGKRSPDPLDVYIGDELGEDLPRLVDNARNDSKLEQKVDLLVGDLQSRQQAERIAELERQLAEANAAQYAATSEQLPVCAGVNVSGEPCKNKPVKQISADWYCAIHPLKVKEEV